MPIVIIMFFLVVVGLTWFMLSRDRGAKEPASGLWAAFGFGVLAVLIAGILEQTLLPDLDTAMDLRTTFFVMMSIGIIEESAKFFPLALFIRRKAYFNEHTDGVLYFALAGLAFGLVENILYAAQFGAQVAVARVIIVPFFHAATSGIIGFYFAKTKLSGGSMGVPLLALGVVAALHGMYDFGLYSGLILLMLVSLGLTLAMSVMLFVYYSSAGRMDRRDGLSSSGLNKYCRSCGVKNLHGNLYCESCGMTA